MFIRKYENTALPRLTGLVKQDEYSFFVLGKILGDRCARTVTDGKRVIICHSSAPYPVWVWMPDGAGERELRRAYKLVKRNFGFDGKYKFNTRYDFARYMIEEAEKEGKSLKISMNIYAYGCPELKKPLKEASGCCVRATEADTELATRYMVAFHKEAGVDQVSEELQREKAMKIISEGLLFFWQAASGEKVAMCSYRVSGNLGSITNVYTEPGRRRMGYAANLVHAAAREILDRGLKPALYTDADYAASNACYEQIGFARVGELCTVSSNNHSS